MNSSISIYRFIYIPSLPRESFAWLSYHTIQSCGSRAAFGVTYHGVIGVARSFPLVLSDLQSESSYYQDFQSETNIIGLQILIVKSR